MSNVQVIDFEEYPSGLTTQMVIITNEDGSYTSMLKSTYDAQQAQANFTES